MPCRLTTFERLSHNYAFIHCMVLSTEKKVGEICVIFNSTVDGVQYRPMSVNNTFIRILCDDRVAVEFKARSRNV